VVAVLPLPDRYNPALRLMGFSDLGRTLQMLADERFQDRDRLFYFAATYDLTAVLAFYGPGKPVAYSADIGGRRRSQYDLWPGPQGRQGHDAMFLARDDQELPPELQRMFARVERIVYRTTHHGRPGRTFTIGLCYGFNGYWPENPTGLY